LTTRADSVFIELLKRRGPLEAAVLGAAVAAACSSAPAPAPVAVAPPAPASEPAPPSPREVATTHFHLGKSHALAGEADCARDEFRKAFEAFEPASRGADPDDAQFAGQLWDSVVVYQALIDPELGERPPVEDPRDTLIAADQAPAPTAEQVEKAKREVAAAGTGVSFDIPVNVNDAVLRAVAYFQFRTPHAFAGALKRSGRYLPLMRELLRREGLPQDLVYMAMIESAFKAQAHSRARAHGFWQFIDGTGKRSFDERSDPVKSTLAAARYLKDLYEMFGDWNLAMAAYDAGEGKILKGLQRTGAKDYWQLAATSFLRTETREYVPYVLAAALISKDPLRYGFDVVPDPPLSFEVVTVPRPLDLARVSEAVGAPVQELALLNSELTTRVTPHGVGPYPLRVPPGTGEALAARLASLPAAAEVRDRKVVARKGDTMAKLAARAGVSVAALCDANDLPRTAKLKKGTVLLLPSGSLARRPAPPAAVAAALAAEGQIRALPTPAAAVTRAADVSPFTAAHDGSRVAAPLPSKIEIPAEGFTTVPASGPAADSASRTRTVRYTVRPGDTLYRIAEKHGTTVDEIRRQNRIRTAESLKAGQRLTLTLALTQ
jgi:membrane-bound lytic murein transglycosylase D